MRLDKPDRRFPPLRSAPVRRAIQMKTYRAQAAETVPVIRFPPREQFIDRQFVVVAGLFERNQSTAHRDNNLGLVTGRPAFHSRWGKIGHTQWRSVGPNDAPDVRAVFR